MKPRQPLDWVALVVALLALLSSAASGYFRDTKVTAVDLSRLQQAHDDDRATISEIKARLQALDDKIDRLLQQR
jgi:hypothetical protein